MKIIKKVFIGTGLFFLLINSINAQTTDLHQIKISGAMRNVMRLGDLTSTIHLDTIQDKKHLYGLGPYENLKGELLILDGKSFVSKVGKDDTIIVEQTYDARAPFFVYGNNKAWRKVLLPATVKDLYTLEAFITEETKQIDQPFIFKLEGEFEQVVFHIQNLPEGTVVKSMKDPHTGQRKYFREKQNGTVVGFYSQHHQTVFTHHDAFIHTHFINNERTEMGHVDAISFNGKNPVYIYLPL